MARRKKQELVGKVEDRYFSSPEEDIVPSQVPDCAWLQCVVDPDAFEKDAHTYTGKWMIFTKTQEETDRLWPIFKRALYENELGDSMKSATTPSMNGVLTCVYTKDWQDIPDIKRVLRTLRTLGIKAKIYYKSDAQTLMGMSGSIYVSPRDNVIELTPKGREWYAFRGQPMPEDM